MDLPYQVQLLFYIFITPVLYYHASEQLSKDTETMIIWVFIGIEEKFYFMSIYTVQRVRIVFKLPTESDHREQDDSNIPQKSSFSIICKVVFTDSFISYLKFNLFFRIEIHIIFFLLPSENFALSLSNITHLIPPNIFPLIHPYETLWR